MYTLFSTKTTLNFVAITKVVKFVLRRVKVRTIRVMLTSVIFYG